MIEGGEEGWEESTNNHRTDPSRTGEPGNSGWHVNMKGACSY